MSSGRRVDRQEETADVGDGPDRADREEDLLAEVELLAEENRRLREEYVRSRRRTYRRTAAGLFAVGAVAALGGVALPSARTVLFALGATGLFAGVLTYYLTPERFLAADTGDRVYAALAELGDGLVAELGLRDDRVYAPARTGPGTGTAVRLFVPQRADYEVPPPGDLDSVFVVADDARRGVALPPTGGGLYREFETSTVEAVPNRPAALADALADALVEAFELVEGASSSVDADGGRATMAVLDSAYGDVDRFDHPVASFFGVGLAAGLDVPVSVTVTDLEEGRADYVVTAEWDGPAAGADAE